MRYTQIMSTARATLPLLGLLLGSLLSLAACRELASPQANLEDRQLVHGIVVRADGVVVPGTRVALSPQSAVFRDQYHEVVYTDDDGRFTAQAPKIPLRVDLLPTVGFGSPRRIEEGAEFAPGVERRFVLPGFAVPGVVTDVGHVGSFYRTWLAVGLSYTVEDGEEKQIFDIARPDEDGRFSAFLFQPGRVQVDFHRNWDVEAGVTLAKDLELAADDSLELELPLALFQLELTLGGSYPPSNDFVVRSDLLPDQSPFFYEDLLRADRAQTLFEVAGLPGATRLQLFRPPNVLHGSHSEWVPQLIILQGLQGQELIQMDLGQHLLEIQLLGPTQEALPRAWLRASRLELSWREASAPVNLDGQCSFWVNPGLHRLRVTDTDYPDHEEWIEISGDMRITITLSEAP